MQMAPGIATTLAGESGTTLAMTVLIAAVIATFGYRLSQRNRVTRGVTPWRIPSIVWAIICFFFAPFGIALELIAIVSTRPDLTKIGRASLPGAYLPVSTPPVVGGPAAPVPDMTAPQPNRSGLTPPVTDESGKSALFGWYRDVTGRHELRYWDGRDWTVHVADSGAVGEDPLKPKPEP